MENKDLFLQTLNLAFIVGDPDRYGHLQHCPIEIRKEGNLELMSNFFDSDARRVNVTGCSCSAIANEFIKNFL